MVKEFVYQQFVGVEMHDQQLYHEIESPLIISISFAVRNIILYHALNSTNYCMIILEEFLSSTTWNLMEVHR